MLKLLHESCIPMIKAIFIGLLSNTIQEIKDYWIIESLQHAYRQQDTSHVKGNVAFVDCGSLFFGNKTHLSMKVLKKKAASNSDHVMYI